MGGLVAEFTIIKIASGVAPKKYIERHVVKLRSIVELKLNWGEIVQVAGLSVSAACALFLLGNYGVEGDFHSDNELLAFRCVMSIGGSSLLITGIWKGLVIHSEIKRDEEIVAAGGTVEEAPAKEKPEDGHVSELSSAWIAMGFLATTVQTVTNIMYACTNDDFYLTVSRSIFPEVRRGMERSDELTRHAYAVSTSKAGTSEPNIAAADSATVSNVINTFSLATRFARRRLSSSTSSCFSLSHGAKILRPRPS